MSTWIFALIVGTVLGFAVAVIQHHRVRSRQNLFVIRNPDESVYGGHYRVLFGVALLWTALGFVVAFPIVALIRWII